jgi:hypothetical protein
MIPRVRTASIALFAVLAVASPCLATVGMAPGRGAIGGQVGGSVFWGGEDYSEGAKTRPALSAHYRYVINNRFRWQVGPGFTWAGYSKAVPMPVHDIAKPLDYWKNTNLTLVLPVSFQLQAMFHTKKWHYHAGAGPGVYRVWVENRREQLKDPVTFNVHSGLYAGFTAEAGVERFLKSLPSTSVEASLASHWIAAQRDAKFPSGYNSSLRVTELRVGANYYFDMGRLGKKSTALPTMPGK